MPVLAVLAAAAQVGQRKHSAAVEERQQGGVERWRSADVESAVAAQQDGRVCRRARRSRRCTRNIETRVPSLRGVPDLTRFVVVPAPDGGRRGTRRGRFDATANGASVSAGSAQRYDEGGSVNDVNVKRTSGRVRLSVEARQRSDAWQGDFASGLARRVEQRQPIARVVQIRRHDRVARASTAADSRSDDCGHDLLERRGRLRRVHGNDPAVRRIAGGSEEETAVRLVDERVGGVEAGEDRDRPAEVSRPGQIDQVDFAVVAGAALRRDDEKPAVGA